MKLTRRKMIAATAVVALAAGGAGASFAAAGRGDDADESVAGPGADRARAAALSALGGTANSVEPDGENGATWEVEVTRPDGKSVDVRLDERYEIVVVESDTEDAGETEDGDGGAIWGPFEGKRG